MPPLLHALKHRALPGLRAGALRRVGAFRPLPSQVLGLLSAATAIFALLVAPSRPWTVPLAGLFLVAAALARAWPLAPGSPAAWRSFAARLATPLLAVYALLLGAGLGLSSAYLVLHRGYPLGSVRAGIWTAWPRIGSREADPYARAVLARRGDIPLGIGEGLALTAAGDEAGRPFDTACTYRITSPTPPARVWTLTVNDGDRPVATESGRRSFTSAEILRDAEGGFEVLLSREAQPGNWLPLPESGRVQLTLRLYDTPAATSSAALDPRTVPPMTRLECRR